MIVVTKLTKYQTISDCLSVLKMARRYDTRTTIFSPEGRLYQVEYAMEAIGHAGTCLGILSNDGIVLAAERRNTNKLLDEVFHSEKIYKLNDDMVSTHLKISRKLYVCIFFAHQKSVFCDVVYHLVATRSGLKDYFVEFRDLMSGWKKEIFNLGGHFF